MRFFLFVAAAAAVSPYELFRNKHDADDIVAALKKDGVITDVLDNFNPLFEIKASFENATVDLGNKIAVSDAQSAPNVLLVPLNGTSLSALDTYTLAMTDPDAPSRKDPKWSQICHWLTDIRITLPRGTQRVLAQGGDYIEYKAPGPPPKTGPHRYVLVLLRSSRQPTPPSARPRWGFEKAGSGVREWAQRERLDVVGANFFVAEHSD